MTPVMFELSLGFLGLLGVARMGILNPTKCATLAQTSAEQDSSLAVPVTRLVDHVFSVTVTSLMVGQSEERPYQVLRLL